MLGPFLTSSLMYPPVKASSAADILTAGGFIGQRIAGFDSTRARLGGFSCPQGQINSEAYGAHSQVTNSSCLSVGYQCQALGANSIAVGNSTTAATNNQTAVGASANCMTGSGYSTAIGYNAQVGTSSPSSIAIGANASVPGSVSNACVIGAGGSSNGSISTLYLNGYTNASPAAVTLQGCGGSGSNINGANLNISGGASTGTGDGGNLNLQVSLPAGSSGSSLNSLTSILTLSGTTGAITITGPATTMVPLTVTAASSTSSDIQDWKISSTKVAYIDQYGRVNGIAWCGTPAQISTGSTITIDGSKGDTQYVQLSSSTTTVAFANFQPGQKVVVLIQQPATGGPDTLSWPGTAFFAGGTAPTLSTGASAKDRLTVHYGANGDTNYYVDLIGLAYAA